MDPSHGGLETPWAPASWDFGAEPVTLVKPGSSITPVIALASLPLFLLLKEKMKKAKQKQTPSDTSLVFKAEIADWLLRFFEPGLPWSKGSQNSASQDWASLLRPPAPCPAWPGRCAGRHVCKCPLHESGQDFTPFFCRRTTLAWSDVCVRAYT